MVAVDGGGTGCRVAVGTAAQGIVAQAKGSPANVATAFDAAVGNIQHAVGEALEKAGWSDSPFEDMRAHVGVAGANSKEMMARVAQAFPYGQCTASGDRETTVVGALEQADGYVVSLGTGTIIARQQAQVVRTVGGWGFHLSDQAAGAWLGRRLLEEVLLAEDGLEPHSALTGQTLNDFGGVQQVVDFAAQARPGAFAKLAVHVASAAESGDAVGQRLMEEGARYIERGLTALGYVSGDLLILSGGLGPSYERWLGSSYTQTLAPQKGAALDGAFAMACRPFEAAE